MSQKQINRRIAESFDLVQQEMAGFNGKIQSLDAILTLFFFASFWQRVKWALFGTLPGFGEKPEARAALTKAAQARARKQAYMPKPVPKRDLPEDPAIDHAIKKAQS